jgi:hypothetical protein
MKSDGRSLRLLMETTDTGARVEKTISVCASHHAIYQEFNISGLDGEFSYGTHPILDLSGLPEGTARITTSPFHWASTFPGAFANPADGETQALAEGAVFTDLREVPLATGGTTDLTRYPARPGNEDLVMMTHVAATPEQPFAWSAAVLDGYLWFSLKNPADFPSTLFWLSNGGRTAAPWNGRHLGRIGIEDVCSHFSNGVDISRLHPLAAQGIPTCRRFTPDATVSLKSIQGVALDPGLGAVLKIAPSGDDSVAVTGSSGLTILVPLHWAFVL